MIELTDIFFSMQLAALAYTITIVLTAEGYILEWYSDLLIKLKNAGFKWLAYPLGYCEKCFAGQLALWVWFAWQYEYHTGYYFFPILRHIIFISFTILFTSLIKTLFKKWK